MTEITKASRECRVEHLRAGDELEDGSIIRASTVTWKDSEFCEVLIAGSPHPYGGGSENRSYRLGDVAVVRTYGFEKARTHG